MPDNCAVDAQGRLWIATDGNSAKATGRTDGVWAIETEGEARGTSKLFFRVPGRCGAVRPDVHARRQDLVRRRSSTLATRRTSGGQSAASRPSTTPSTRWPDFKDGVPPRPSIVVITKEDGGDIGA